MPYNDKIQEQLAQEIESLRSQLTDLRLEHIKRKQAEEELWESERRFLRLLEGLPLAVFVLDAQGKPYYQNKASRELFGKDFDPQADGRLPETYQAYLAGTDQPYPQERSPIRRALDGESSTVEDMEIRRPDKTIPVEVYGSPIYNLQGGIKYAVGVFQDISERLRAEEALRRSEAFTRAVITHSPVGITVRDREGPLVLYNEAWKKIWTLSDERVQENERISAGWSFEKRYPHLKAYAPNAQQLFQKGGELFIPEVETGSTAPGVAQWVSLHFYALKNAEGLVEQVVTLTEDITPRKRAQEALRKSEALSRAVIEHSPLGITVRKPNWELVLYNQALKDLWAMTDQEVEEEERRNTGLSFDDRFPLTRPWSREVRRVFKAGEEYFIPELETHHPNPAAARWISLRYYALQNETGEVQQVVTLTEDITARKKIEESLRQSEERYRSLMDNLNVGVYRNTPGPKGKFIEANPALFKMVGYSDKEEFLQINVSDLYQNPDDRAYFNEKLLGHGFVQNEVIRLKKKDGLLLWASVTAVAVRDEDGTVKYYDGIIEDISERKRAEESLRQAKDELEQRVKERTAELQEAYHRQEERTQQLSCILDAGSSMLLNLGLDSLLEEIAKSARDTLGYEVVVLNLIDEKTREARFAAQAGLGEEAKRVLSESAVRMKWDDLKGLFQERFRVGRSSFFIPHGTIDWRKTDPVSGTPASDATIPEDFDKQPWDPDDALLALVELREKTVAGMFSLDRPRDGKRPSPETLLSLDLFANLASVAIDNARLYDQLRKAHDELELRIQERTQELARVNAVLQAELAERKAAEEALSQSEKRYRAVMEQTVEGIILYDAESKRALEANPAYCKLLGYLPEEFLDLTLYDLQADEPKAIDRNVQRICSERRAFLGERRHRCKDGSLVDVEVSASLITYGGKEALCMIVRDITERKKNEVVLSESEEKYRTVVENVNIGVYRNTGGPQGQFVQVNPAMIKMFGYGSAEEFMARPVAECYQNPEEREHFIAKIKRHGFARDEELRLRKKNSSPFWASVTGQAQFDARGEVIWIDGVIEDITERKRAEEVLRESEGKYRKLVELTLTGFLILNHRGVVIDANPEYVRLTGHRTLAEILGRSVLEWTADYEKEKNARAVEECARAGYVNNLEIDYIDGQGKITPIEINAFVEGTGEALHIISLCRDISERRRAEEALRESEERFRQLVEAAPDVIYTISAEDGTFTSLNPAFEKVTEWPREEWLGKPFTPLIHPEDIPRAVETFEMALRGEKTPLYQLRILSKTGEYRVGEFISTPLIAGGKVVGELGIARDITNRKRTEKALREGERFLGDVFRSIQDGLSVLDKDYTILQVNATMEWWYAHAMPLAGKKCYEAYHGLTEPCEVCPTEHTLQTGESAYEVVPKCGPGGETTGWLDLFTFPLIDAASGTMTGVIEYVRDITDRRQAEEELKVSFEKLKRMSETVIQAMAMIVEMKDPYTAGHQRNVAALACAIALEMGLSKPQVDSIRVAALIHDVGKIYIPSEILTRPGPLSEVEHRMIKTHPQLSYDILRTIEFPWPVAEIVWQHHEKLNGSGYPQGLREDQIKLEAKILSVADTVESLALHRPYRPGKGIDLALEEIARQRGELYDQGVVDACLRLFADKRFAFE